MPVQHPKPKSQMKSHLPSVFAAFVFILLSSTSLQAQIGQLEATVVSRKGKIVELQLISQTGDAYATGTVADMSKYFEEKIGKMTMTGWLTVAKVKFIPTTRQNIMVEILEEKGEITVNDEKVDHFKVGKRMKLEWPATVADQNKSTE